MAIFTGPVFVPNPVPLVDRYGLFTVATGPSRCLRSLAVVASSTRLVSASCLPAYPSSALRPRRLRPPRQSRTRRTSSSAHRSSSTRN